MMSRRITLVRHISREDLESKCRKQRDGRVKERALAILRLYDGTTEGETARSVARCEKSVRNWLKRWNEKGYDGLVPEFDGGQSPG